MDSATPLMKQYREIKKQYPDTLLFFRVGDFYEMFFEDAITASKILQITLTSRDKNKEHSVPLCGVPHHAASGYIAKLIKAGQAVAVCEQMEDPAAAKGIIKREVVRVITPGAVIESDLLSEKENNFVAALHWDFSIRLDQCKEIGLAYLDLSTGDFQMVAFSGKEAWAEAKGELSKIDPKELVLPALLKERPERIGPHPWPVRFGGNLLFAPDAAEACLKAHFQVHSTGSLGEEKAALSAAGALLGYAQETQRTRLANITTLRRRRSSEHMRLDPLAQRHLDLIPQPHQKGEGTLLYHLDLTVTAMGARLLREWILRPLVSAAAIKARQDAIAFFHDNFPFRSRLRTVLKEISDLERLIGRITLRAGHPRDLIALKQSIERLPEIRKNEIDSPPLLIQTLFGDWDNLEDLWRLIESALVPDPPLAIKGGGYIKEGHRPALDELRKLQKEGRSSLTGIELEERKRTGIESLKVRYNQVFGYYIEVSETHLHKIPADYIRKQTLTRAERFTTASLREMEEKLLGAEEAIHRLEEEAFEALRQTISLEVGRVLAAAQKIGLLDLFSALAEVAAQNRYVRPEVNEGRAIRIFEGRHPVLERLGEKNFVPNDTLLDHPDHQLLILTGPNMAGKSTYMRQVALIVLMAQIGSFIPAREAAIGVVDQIFTRVGAQDSLSEGMSTFMVEMTEVSQILRHATERSLILLDEIGRGTSTFDGMSIAWAIAEYVHSERLGARTLFATHYHELTQLAQTRPGIRNYHIAVREWNDEIIFLRKIVEGGADKSYGIQVARLAGLPSEVIERAKKVLRELEERSWTPIVSSPRQAPDLFSLPSPPPPAHPLLEALRQIDPLRMTPLDALVALTELIDKAKRES